MIDSDRKGHPATAPFGDTVENLIESGLIRFGDQPAPQVFLQGLMRTRGPLTQNPVGVFRNILDLHARHGAILAPMAPKYNHALHPGGHLRLIL
nr:hypothetical protein [Mycobacterium lacus]